MMVHLLLQAGVYGYGGERSSSWWVSMAAVLIGREPSEREERSLDALNRCAGTSAKAVGS